MPLWTATGAGAISRQVLGSVVIGGMLAASFLAIFFIPVSFDVVERFGNWIGGEKREPLPALDQLLPQETPMTSLEDIGGHPVGAFSCPHARSARTTSARRPPFPINTADSLPTPRQQATAQPFAEMQWASVYQDEVLQGLIKEALTNNYDMRIAATRVLQANANLGIVRADQFPTLNGSGSIINERSQLTNLTTDKSPTFDTLALSLNYIVDFWGQYRRATESARATLLATEYGQEVVRTSLISSVATDYFLLRQYDEQLEFSKKTVEADKEILKLNEIKFKGGESAITDVYQAQTLLQQAEAQVISTQQFIEQTENNISILLGRNPGPIARGLNVTRAAAPARSARRTAFGAVGASSRCAPRRGKPGCCQCQCGRGQGSLLPADFADRHLRCTKHGHHQLPARAGNLLGRRRTGAPTALPGRQD